VISPYTGNTVTGVISMSSPTHMDNKMDNGIVFVVYCGVIINSISTDAGTLPLSDVKTGGSYTIANLPGGTAQNPLTTAFYGIDADFWSSATATNPFTDMVVTFATYEAVAFPPQEVDLRTGNDTANLTMYPLF